MRTGSPTLVAGVDGLFGVSIMLLVDHYYAHLCSKLWTAWQSILTRNGGNVV